MGYCESQAGCTVYSVLSNVWLRCLHCGVLPGPSTVTMGLSAKMQFGACTQLLQLQVLLKGAGNGFD